MAEPPTPEVWHGPGYPPGHPPIQLTVHVDIFRDEVGGCAISFGAPEGSELVSRYGGKGRALAACRDAIVHDLDVLIREFFDEE